MKTLEALILKYPTHPWNWEFLSSNSSVSFQFILDNPSLPWVPKYVSTNESITEEIVRSNLAYAWDFEGLCSNPNMSFSFFNEFMISPPEVKQVDWHLLSSNKSITIFDIIQNPHQPWSDRYLSMNPNITSNYILNEGKDRNWDVELLCSNPGITSRDIFKNALAPLLKSKGGWNYRNLSSNPNLPIGYVNDNLDKDWNLFTISCNASMNDIQTYNRINWDDYGLSLNTNINFDFVKHNKKRKWSRKALLSNSAISQSDIIDNIDWFRFDNSFNIEEYMSSNKSITIPWIEKNIQKIDWTRLSMNKLS